MRRNRVNRRFLLILIGGAMLVTMGSLGLLEPVKTAVAWVVRPVVGVASGAAQGTGDVWKVVTSAGSLAKENQQLRSDNASLRQRLSEATELKAQNEELRKQLNVGAVRSDSLIASEVIGYQPDNFRQFITIGRGSRDGIEEGMAVVSQGALVGTIQDVTPSTARVFLVIDPNFRVTALDQDLESRPTGTIRGQIGSGLVMDKIAQNEPVKPGDTIVTSGTGSEIPKGLIVGRVQTVDRKDNGVFQTAQVSSDISFNRLEIVYVVRKP